MAKFSLRDAIVALLWNVTNSSESQSASMLPGRGNNPQLKAGAHESYVLSKKP